MKVRPWQKERRFEPKVMEVDGSNHFPDFNWVIIQIPFKRLIFGEYFMMI